MKSIIIPILFIIIIIAVVSCSPASRYTTDTRITPRSRYYRTTSPHSDLPPSGVDYIVGATYKWMSSYYGADFHGKQTSNGEIYDMYGLTCAHRELPFNTMLRATNPVNNKSVTVRVNDRGPFISGRELDLSLGAAQKIDMVDKGVKELHIEIISMP
jgi:hypothetical protein